MALDEMTIDFKAGDTSLMHSMDRLAASIEKLEAHFEQVGTEAVKAGQKEETAAGKAESAQKGAAAAVDKHKDAVRTLETSIGHTIQTVDSFMRIAGTAYRAIATSVRALTESMREGMNAEEIHQVEAAYAGLSDTFSNMLAEAGRSAGLFDSIESGLQGLTVELADADSTLGSFVRVGLAGFLAVGTAVFEVCGRVVQGVANIKYAIESIVDEIRSIPNTLDVTSIGSEMLDAQETLDELEQELVDVRGEFAVGAEEVAEYERNVAAAEAAVTLQRVRIAELEEQLGGLNREQDRHNNIAEETVQNWDNMNTEVNDLIASVSNATERLGGAILSTSVDPTLEGETDEDRQERERREQEARNAGRRRREEERQEEERRLQELIERHEASYARLREAQARYTADSAENVGRFLEVWITRTTNSITRVANRISEGPARMILAARTREAQELNYLAEKNRELQSVEEERNRNTLESSMTSAKAIGKSVFEIVGIKGGEYAIDSVAEAGYALGSFATGDIPGGILHTLSSIQLAMAAADAGKGSSGSSASSSGGGGAPAIPTSSYTPMSSGGEEKSGGGGLTININSPQADPRKTGREIVRNVNELGRYDSGARFSRRVIGG